MYNNRRVSIIIPFYKNKENLMRCVKHCLALNYTNYEILVLGTRDSFIKEANIRWLIVDQESQGFKRNEGIKAATGDICAFIDDDAYPDREWIKNAVIYFEDEKIGAVCGPGVSLPGESPSEKISSVILESHLGTGKARYRYTPTTKHILKNEIAPAYNLFVRRSLLLEIGGFPVGIRAAEDAIVSEKIREKEYSILYVPNVVVYHQRRKFVFPLLRQLYTYAVYRGNLIKKGRMRDPFYLLPLMFIFSVFFLFIAFILNMSFISGLFPLIKYAVLIYFVAAIVSGYLTGKGFIMAVISALGLPLVHVTYAWGYLSGLIRSNVEDLSSY